MVLHDSRCPALGLVINRLYVSQTQYTEVNFFPLPDDIKHMRVYNYSNQ